MVFRFKTAFKRKVLDPLNPVRFGKIKQRHEPDEEITQMKQRHQMSGPPSSLSIIDQFSGNRHKSSFRLWSWPTLQPF